MRKNGSSRETLEIMWEKLCVKLWRTRRWLTPGITETPRVMPHLKTRFRRLRVHAFVL